jgi:mRNA-degrading endonuclease RelE of RelBE toxin-antitoxin system
MNIEYLAKFSKDLDKITLQATKNAILNVIEEVRQANRIGDIKNVKKLVGYKTAYRIRVGEYRIGFFYENDTVIFARIASRKDIYNLFP